MTSTTKIEGPGECTQCVTAHAVSLLDNLNLLFKSREFCDVRLLVDSEIFCCHKNVLCAASPYFHAMFSTGMMESNTETIEIRNISSSTFKILLDFIYTGKLFVTEENCQDVLDCADMFQLEEVVNICCSLLERFLQTTNCIGISLFADAHYFTKLKKASEDFTNSHFFQVVCDSSEFLDLPVDALLKILDREELQVDNEIQVFQAVIKWLHYDSEERRSHVFDVLSRVRFPLTSLDSLRRCLAECFDPHLKGAIEDCLEFLGVWESGKRWLCSPRAGASKDLFIVGGFSRSAYGGWLGAEQTQASVESLNSLDTRQWRPLPPLHQARSGLGLCSLNGSIYCIGGECDSMIFGSVERYDPRVAKWSWSASLLTPRTDLGVSVVDGRIYAIGGWIGAEMGDTVEVYDPCEDTWTVADTMQTKRVAMATCEHQGLMYAIGGQGNWGTELKTMESYNPVIREWTRLADLATRRAYVCAAVLGDHIYAVGGSNSTDGSLDSVERYSIQNVIMRSYYL